ncbi:MAG: T9SS type A sorting domain-containing protein [Chitinophagaceae bacterium]|nr:MAG: T9SS type A sorting domain-containing protein [Chitinophagaceae bacterium]
MSKLAALILILFLTDRAGAQVADNAPWAPPGATWIYRKTGPSPTSYYRYNYDSDTLIDGRPAKKLKLTILFFAGPPGFPPSVAAGSTECYYQSNDSLFWWNAGQFQFLYDFGASAGDRWVERNSRYQPCADPAFPPQDTLKVRTLRADTLGGRIYTRLEVRSDSQYFQTGAVLRNIGSLLSPYPLKNEGKCFLMQHPDGAYDPYEFDQLVCYYDNIRGFVPVFTMSGTAPDCNSLSNYILATLPEAPFRLNGWSAVPNPVRNSVRVSGAGAKAQYRIITMDGRVLRAGLLGSGMISTADLAPGMYLLEVVERERRSVQKLLRQ